MTRPCARRVSILLFEKFLSWILKNVELAQKCWALSVQPFNVYFKQTNRLAIDVYMGEVEFLLFYLTARFLKMPLMIRQRKNAIRIHEGVNEL